MSGVSGVKESAYTDLSGGSWLDALKRTAFPKLVMSGGHHPAFEAVCDLIATELKAERAVIRGAGHSTQRTGAPFNTRIEAFLKWA